MPLSGVGIGAASHEDAQLSATMDVDPATIVPGEPVTYTITVYNAGPGVARAVRVTDPLPDGLTAAEVVTSVGGVTCEVEPVALCELGDLDVDAKATVTITASTSPSLSSDVVNTATVSADTTDPEPRDNEPTTTTPVAPLADVTVTQSLVDDSIEPGVAIPGRNVTYRLTVTNRGPSTARDVSLIDTLPAGLTATSISGAPASCDFATTTCNIGDLAPGSIDITLVARLDAAHTDALVNRANVTTSTAQPAPHEPDATELSTPVTPRSDVRVEKTVDLDPVTAGGDVTWRFMVTNDGPSVAHEVTFEDVLPAFVVGGSATVDGDGACSVEAPRTVRCAWPTLAHRDARRFSVTADVSSDALVDADNTAWVDAADDIDDGNNSAVASSSLITSADLVVTADVPADAEAGMTAMVSFVVENRGPSVARQTVLSEELPDGVTVVSPLPAGCEASTETHISCDLGDLGLTSLTLDFEVAFDATLMAGDVELGPSAASSTDDPNLSNNSEPTQISIERRAEISIDKRALTDSVIAGQSASFVLVVANGGPSTAEDVVVVDTLPDGMTALSAEVTTGAGTCEIDTTVRCELGTLDPDSSVEISIVAFVAPSVADGADLENKAVASTITPQLGAEPDEAFATVSVTREADLGVSVNVVPTTAHAGNGATIRASVANTGPSDAANVALTLAIPSGFFVESSSLGCATVGTDLVCSRATLASGLSYDVTLTGFVSRQQLTDLLFAVSATTVTEQGTDDEPNSASDTLGVTQLADVRVVKTAPTEPVVAGTEMEWTISVENAGPSAARNVIVADTFPAGFTLTEVSGAGCSALPCTLDWVNFGPSLAAKITVTGKVDASFADDTLTNVATITTTTPDTFTLDNRAAATADIRREADLVVTKTATPAVAGSDASFTITIRNDGPSDATTVAFADTMPIGFDALAVSHPGCAITGDLVSCGIGTLAPDDEVEVTIDGKVKPGQPAGNLINTVVVTSATPDPNGATAAATMGVTRVADVAIEKRAGPDAVPGVVGGATWQIIVTNAGPSTATSVDLNDVLPSAVTGATFSGACVAMPCTIGPLAPGSETTIDVTATVPSNYGSGVDAVENVVNIVAVADPDPTDSDWSGRATVATTPEAALVVTKTGPATVVAGDPISWEVNVVNNGPSVARAVQITDALPAGLTGPLVVSGTCSSIPCAVGDLAVGQEANLTITSRVRSGYSGATIANVATARSSTPAALGDKRSHSVTSTVTTRADLQVLVELVGQARAGATAEYLVSVVNHGRSDAANVAIDGVLPEGTAMVGANGPLGACALPCSIGSVPSGLTSTMTMLVAIPGSMSGSTLSMSVSVQSSTPDPGVYPNSDDLVSLLIIEHNISIEKALVGSAVPGEAVAWTLTVRNHGPADARAVVVNDLLPESVSNGEAAVVTPNGRGVCTTVVRSMSCNLGTIGVEAFVITVTGDLSPHHLGLIVNEASVSSVSADTNFGDNVGRSASASSPRADVSVSFDTGGSVIAGTNEIVRATVTNAGPSLAENVSVALMLPAEVQFTGAPTVTGGSGQCQIEGSTATCAIGSVGPTNAIEVVLPIHVNAGFAGIAVLGSVVTTTTDEGSASANNLVDGLLAVAISADLRVTKSTQATADVGDTVTYRIVTTNHGPSTAVNVEITDPVIDLLRPLAARTTAGRCTLLGQVVTCFADRLEPGESVVVEIDVEVAGKGSISNTVFVASDSTDAVVSDNVASAVLEIRRYADLRVTKTADRLSARVGDTVTYTVIVSNYGPDDALSVVAVDELGSGLVFASADVTQGTFDTATNRWLVGDVRNGGSAVLRMRAVVAASGQITNRVSLEANVIDASPGSNVDVVGVIVVGVSLPETGSDLRMVMTLGSLLVGAGMVAVAAARRRQDRLRGTIGA